MKYRYEILKSQAAAVSSNILLSAWSDDRYSPLTFLFPCCSESFQEPFGNSTHCFVNFLSECLFSSYSREADTDVSRRNLYLTLYGIFGGLQSLFTFIAIMIMTFGTVKASIRLHDTLLKKILRAPMSFFDTTPTGRIVNRFSR